jgi:hypothetical protein
MKARKVSGVVAFFLAVATVGGLCGLIVGAAPVGAAGNGARPTPTTVPEGSAPSPQLQAASCGYANLTIDGIQVLPLNPLVGSQATILITVANHGSGYPTNQSCVRANFFVDIFLDPPVSSPSDLLSMPSYAPVASAGLQGSWLPAGASYVVSIPFTFSVSGMHDLYAVVDIAELGSPWGNVYEGPAGEGDNATGPYTVEVRLPDAIIAKDNSDFVRGPASSLALVASGQTPSSAPVHGLQDQALTVGDTALTLGYFDETPSVWGLTDPLTPDYDMQSLDARLNDDATDRPQQYPRLASVPPVYNGDGSVQTPGLLVAVWQDRRNSALVDWDIYMTYSTDGGATWKPNVRVNNDAAGNDQRRPAVAISPVDNRVLVVWQDNRTTMGNTSAKYRIMGQFYTFANGTLTPLQQVASNLLHEGGNFVLSAASTTNSMNADVAAGADGNFYVVWQDDQYGHNEIYLRGWKASTGTWMDNPRRVGDDTNSNKRSPRVAAGAAQILSSYSTVCGTPPGFVLNSVQVQPIVVTWEDDRNRSDAHPNDTDIYMTYSIDQAQTFDRDRRINDDALGDGVPQLQPVVGVAQMYQKQTLTSNNPWCPDATGDVVIPSVAFYFGWQDFRNSSNTTMDNNPDIFMSVSSGVSIQGDTLHLDLTPSANEQLNPKESVPIWQDSPTLVCRSYPGIQAGDNGTHNAFYAWVDHRNYGAGNADIYMAVRGDGGSQLPASWNDGIIQVNSGTHATNLPGSSYLQYTLADPPAAEQASPSIAADIVRVRTSADSSTWKHYGFVYLAWNDNRRGGYDQDIYFARSNMSYFSGYRFYPDPKQSGQVSVGTMCHYGSGSYVSPIYDVGAADVQWGRIDWNASTPSGTYLTLQTRTSDDPNNMGQWSPKVFPFADTGLPGTGAPLQGYGTPANTSSGRMAAREQRAGMCSSASTCGPGRQGGPLNSNGNCGSPADSPQVIYDPTAQTPVLYSVTLHYRSSGTRVYLPLTLRFAR